MVIRNVSSYPFLFALFLLSQACVSSPVENVFEPRYLTDERHYTFAIYNSDNLLITHPYEDWKRAYLRAEKEGEPYTDLYLVSHGWNFTHQEALSNYYRHIQMADYFLPASNLTQIPASPGNGTIASKFCPEEHLDKDKNKCDFKPYFIFVVWNSTSRPLSESAYSIFPFGAEDLIAEILRFVDLLAFHIPSTWKQSINASRNAIGRRINTEVFYYYPIENDIQKDQTTISIQERYKKYSKTVGPLQRKYYFYNCTPYASRKHLLFLKEHLAGREMPLATLLAQIIKPRKESLINERVTQKIKYLDDEIIKLKNSLKKASAFNLLQNLQNQYTLENLREEKFDTEEFKKLFDTENFKSFLKTCQDTVEAYEPGSIKVHLVGHSFGAKLVALAGIHGINLTQTNKNYNGDPSDQRANSKSGISSLILFNPAFHAFELEPVLREKINTHAVLKTIPKKVIIYSNTDYATGFLFETSQKLMNATLAQETDKYIYEFFAWQRNVYSKTSAPFNWLIFPYIEVSAMSQGFYSIGTTIAFSSPAWFSRTASTFFADISYHLKNNGEGAFKLFNPIHFFMPIDKLYPVNIGKPTSLDADLYGLWRGVDTALGRSGLTNQTKGRSLRYLGNLSPGLYKFNRPKNNNHGPSINNSANLFIRISCFKKSIKNDHIRINFNNEELKELATEEIKKGVNIPDDFEKLSFFNNPDEFFSIDGSLIYDTAWVPFIGSHGDLRDDNRSSACQNLFKILKPSLQAKIKQEHPHIETEEDKDNISKRHATFNFIIKFTQGELVAMEPANLP